MLIYDRFYFAAAPYTGWSAFYASCTKNGVTAETVPPEEFPATVHRRFTDHNKFSVTLIRNPYAWLWSFYQEATRPVGNPWFDSLLITRNESVSFANFIHRYTERMPGLLMKMYYFYHADSMLRIEDFPKGMADFLETIGVPPKDYKIDVPRPGFMKPAIDNKIRSAVLRAEEDFCELFGYY